MKRVLLFFSLSLCFPVYSSIPTGESLFRNVSNANITSSTVILSLNFKEISDGDLQDKAKLKEISKDVTDQISFKLFFNLDKDERVSFVQVARRGRDLLDLTYAKNLLGHISQEKSEIDKKIFYSVLLSLVLNKADGFNYFLKKYSKGHMKNSELTNSAKRRLIDSYKRYLYTVKDDPSLKNSLKSPLRPDKDEDRHKVNQLMKEGLFLDNGTVKLIQENGIFYWNYELSNFKALFSNEKKQLVNVLYEGGDIGPIQIVADEYILFDGTHELPKFLSIKGSDGKIYYVEFKTLEHVNENGSAFIERLEKLVQEYKLRKEREHLKRPIFIF